MHRNLLKGKSFFLDSVGKILIVNIHLEEEELSNSTHTEDIVSENFMGEKKQNANFVEPNGTEHSAKTFLETRHSISKDGNLKLGYNLIN